MGNFANRRLGWEFVIRKPRKKVARFIVTGARSGMRDFVAIFYFIAYCINF